MEILPCVTYVETNLHLKWTLQSIYYKYMDNLSNQFHFPILAMNVNKIFEVQVNIMNPLDYFIRFCLHVSDVEYVLSKQKPL